MPSDASAMVRLIQPVSCRGCFSLPMCFTQGFSARLVAVAGLSLTASITNSRRETPRPSAICFARRNTASGISKVIFTVLVLHIYRRRFSRRPRISKTSRQSKTRLSEDRKDNSFEEGDAKLLKDAKRLAGKNLWSGLSESNRHLNLGKVPYYHYTKAAQRLFSI